MKTHPVTTPNEEAIKNKLKEILGQEAFDNVSARYQVPENISKLAFTVDYLIAQLDLIRIRFISRQGDGDDNDRDINHINDVISGAEKILYGRK